MEKRTLHLLWTNADPLTAHNMVMMYATNSMLRHWWDEVVVVIWGATTRYVAEDVDIQQRIALAMQAGVRFTACSACAANLGSVEKLKALGVEVRAWGEPLTQLLQTGQPVLTV